MTRVKIITGIVSVLILFTQSIRADDDNWCGKMIVGNWKVVDDGGIYDHILKKVKVKYQKNNEQFDIDIEDDSTPKNKYEGTDFTLSCNARPPSAVLTGDVVIDGCSHTLNIIYPSIENGTSQWHKVAFEYPNSHPLNACESHLDHSSHSDGVHPGTAHGSDN